MNYLLILPLIALLSISATYAPQAENDATWEETTAFINKYKSYLHYTRHYNDPCRDEIKDFNISGNQMYFINLPGRGPGNESKNTVDLSKLDSVAFDNDAIYLFLVGPYWKQDYNPYTSSSTKFSWKSSYLTICDEEMKKRMYNAFSHLAKLATEKREADRKASGDKF
ncbi:MAG: hypothetical protein JXQ87_08430 [Bacteroidia bacterium]